MSDPFAPGCPHCEDGHEPPWRRAWAVWVGPERDADSQPVTLHVEKTGCQHVAEADAQWLREVIANARAEQARTVLRTWGTQQ